MLSICVYHELYELELSVRLPFDEFECRDLLCTTGTRCALLFMVKLLRDHKTLTRKLAYINALKSVANWRHYVLILPHWLNVPEYLPMV